jgi:hypothetical protein
MLLCSHPCFTVSDELVISDHTKKRKGSRHLV